MSGAGSPINVTRCGANSRSRSAYAGSATGTGKDQREAGFAGGPGEHQLIGLGPDRGVNQHEWIGAGQRADRHRRPERHRQRRHNERRAARTQRVHDRQLGGGIH